MGKIKWTLPSQVDGGRRSDDTARKIAEGVRNSLTPDVPVTVDELQKAILTFKEADRQLVLSLRNMGLAPNQFIAVGALLTACSAIAGTIESHDQLFEALPELIGPIIESKTREEAARRASDTYTLLLASLVLSARGLNPEDFKGGTND